MPRLDINPRVRFLRMFARRGLLAAFLVFATYNSSGTSYVHWVMRSDRLSVLQIAVGIALFTALLAMARMAFLSIGYFGLAALSLMIVMVITLGVGLGLFVFDDVRVTPYMVEFWITLVLGIGNGWSFVQKRISGERDVLRNPP